MMQLIINENKLLEDCIKQKKLLNDITLNYFINLLIRKNKNIDNKKLARYILDIVLLIDLEESSDNQEYKLFEKIKRNISKERNFDNQMFKYNANNVELNVFYRAILYITRDTEERKLVIVTPTNKYKVSMTIKEIMEHLDKRFVQCHRSCIVNKDHVEVKNYKEGYFILDNGEKVYLLSKMNKKLMEND